MHMTTVRMPLMSQLVRTSQLAWMAGVDDAEADTVVARANALADCWRWRPWIWFCWNILEVITAETFIASELPDRSERLEQILKLK